MRMTRLFSQTLRDTPTEADIPSHQLLLRAGYIRQLAAGIFSYLPLAQRSLTKIENIMRQEIDAIGGQEITMPVVHPAEIWQESGRWYKIGSEMGRFKDKNGRDMVLSMTHEEVVADLARKEIRSYRQLPQLIYHIQTKWRDDPRPRAGLIRVREFTMKDSYSLDADWEGLDKQYRAHYQAYFNIYHRCSLPARAVKSDVGMMGGQMAHEFMYLTPSGEDTLMICPVCGYSVNRQIARFAKSIPVQENPKPIEKIATPNCKSIEDLANYLGIDQSQTAKAVFTVASVVQDKKKIEKFIFAVVRGDMEVNETKLANAINAIDLRPATEEEIRATGAVPGYASPVDLTNVLVVVDDIIPQSANLVSGANDDGYHLLNVNYGRDYQANIISDITTARPGDPCPECHAPLQAARGVEVGNIFKLGTHFSEAFGCNFLDQSGQTKPIVMGSYGIGSGRLLACIAEQHHDQFGLSWPITVAPYTVHMVLLAGKNKSGGQNTREVADQLYAQFKSASIEVLLDDRDESPGVKFNDADLIGNPLRITVSERALSNGGVEYKRRDQPEKTVISLDQAISRTLEDVQLMENEITKKCVEIPYH
ncbi:MAG: proline--tRNA ligase [Chloroflexi bacterium RBG_19FT_COMBO_49_13]|nr:MAG: proline--tRNA ligase [Chloroflexi bacterium RBG_19FT_COMBO_49_13]